MEHIEQSLSDVLQGQALSQPKKGREVAEALVGALDRHSPGRACRMATWKQPACWQPRRRSKLRSDGLHLSTANGQADDVAGIGATLFHMPLPNGTGLSATDAQINRIPAPFAEIVRNSFARRWTLPQVANALKPPPPVREVVAVAPPPPAAPPPPPVPVAAPVSVPVPASVEQPAVRLQYRPAAAAVATATQEEDEPEPERPAGAVKRSSLSLYGALAVIVLAIIGWLVFRPSGTSTPSSTTAQPVAQEPAAAPTPRPTERAAQHPTPAKPAAAVAASSGHPVWRVVVYTYKGPQQAKEMVDKISGKHPNLDVSVFNPHGKRGIYLVTIGGAMDHDQAVKMQDKAVRLGLPPDTYVQNFSE